MFFFLFSFFFCFARNLSLTLSLPVLKLRDIASSFFDGRRRKKKKRLAKKSKAPTHEERPPPKAPQEAPETRGGGKGKKTKGAKGGQKKTMGLIGSVRQKLSRRGSGLPQSSAPGPSPSVAPASKTPTACTPSTLHMRQSGSFLFSFLFWSLLPLSFLPFPWRRRAVRENQIFLQCAICAASYIVLPQAAIEQRSRY